MAGTYGMRPYIRGAKGVGGRSKSAEQIYAERKRGEGPPELAVADFAAGEISMEQRMFFPVQN